MKQFKDSVSSSCHVGKDPEVKNLCDRTNSRLSIATTDNYKNAKGEKSRDRNGSNLVDLGQAGRYRWAQ